MRMSSFIRTSNHTIGDQGLSLLPTYPSPLQDPGRELPV
jgi:hypothetical protein